MRAASEEVIFNFESNLEKGFKDYLLDAGLESYNSENFSELPQDHIGVLVNIGEATGHIMMTPYNKPEYDQYFFTVEFIVQTDHNPEVGRIPEIKRKHLELVAKVRRAFSVCNAKGNLDDYLDFYEIQTLVPNVTNREIDGEMDVERTTIIYSGQFSILPTAMP